MRFRLPKTMMVRKLLIIASLLGFSIVPDYAQAIVYIVNSNNDVDDGACNVAHCSLREAINASEADNRASIISFNIPGPSPQRIVPNGPLPTINDDSTDIGVPSNVPNKVLLDFSYRDFGGTPFLQINGNLTRIFGLDFTKMLYNSNTDHIFRVGTPVINAQNVSVSTCSFYEDNSIVAGINRKAIDIVQADKIVIDSNSFGTDRLNSQIYSTLGSILVEPTQDGKQFTIDKNIFVTKQDAIDAQGGIGVISNNLFGSYDTTKSQNFLDPINAIELSGGNTYTVDTNFFFGLTQYGIIGNNLAGLVEIKRNRFYNGINDIDLIGLSNATIGIRNNFARLGSKFISTTMSGAYSLNIDFNNVAQYDDFYLNTLDPTINLASYNGNTMLCISNRVVALDNTKSPKPNVPSVTSVNRNQILGTADPNMFVAVYANPNNCVKANTNCQGGFLLGITQANAVGSWVLNVNYPNKHSISAYQYRLGTGYNIYSEFSPCYQCLGPVKERFTPTLCATSSVSYRGKNYGAANPKDSIVVKGDGVSICDSTFVVDLTIKNASREVRNLNICFNQSINICNVTIDKNNPIDSCNLKTVEGCDSTIVFIGTERGLSTFKSTICSNASVTIGSQVFDKNKTSGQVVLPGQSAFGCDSIIDVQLTVKNYAEENYIKQLCPGDFVIVKGKRYDVNNPKGTETFVNGSATGCDSIVNIDLSYTNPVSFKNYSLCVGDSLLIPGTGKYLSSSKLNDTLFIPNGSFLMCDSTVFITITPIPNSIGNFKKSICRKDTLTLGGQIFHAGRTMGSFQIVNGSANGCDSTVQVELSVLPDAIGRLDTVSCEGSTVSIYGSIFSETRPDGTIKAPITSYQGCDTFIMVNVLFIKEKQGATNPTICRTGSINIGGTVFSAANPSGTVRISRPAAQGCDSVISVTVNIAPPISTVYETADLICNKANSGKLTVNTITAGTATNFNVILDNQAPVKFIPSQLFDKLNQGLHSLKIIDGFGCDTTITFKIDTSQTLTLQLPADTTIAQGASIIINPKFNFIPAIIDWDPSSYLSCTNCLNPVSTPDQDITYTLTLEDDFGCSVSDNITIKVKVDEADIYMPNAFSPNGDQINDVVEPEFRFPTRTKINIFRIFDRWGALVYEKTDGGLGEKFGWNGQFHGRELLPGVYTYAIQYEFLNQEPKWKFGDLTLVR